MKIFQTIVATGSRNLLENGGGDAKKKKPTHHAHARYERRQSVGSSDASRNGDAVAWEHNTAIGCGGIGKRGKWSGGVVARRKL